MTTVNLSADSRGNNLAMFGFLLALGGLTLLVSNSEPPFVREWLVMRAEQASAELLTAVLAFCGAIGLIVMGYKGIRRYLQHRLKIEMQEAWPSQFGGRRMIDVITRQALQRHPYLQDIWSSKNRSVIITEPDTVQDVQMLVSRCCIA